MCNGNDIADHFVLICSKCNEGNGAARLRAKLNAGLPAGYALRAVDCMAGCDHPRTVGFQATGKATYLFGGINGPADIDAIVEFGHQYRQSANGWTCAGERPPALHDKTLARIPALKSARRP